MSDVALLMSIRDQLADSLAIMKDSFDPELVTGEAVNKIVGWGGRFEVFEYEDALEAFRTDTAPKSIRYWPHLSPVLKAIKRLDSYIEAASKV